MQYKSNLIELFAESCHQIEILLNFYDLIEQVFVVTHSI